MSLVLEGQLTGGDLEVDLSLTVERGQTVALVGPNGAGKTTVLRAIAGLEALRSGVLRCGEEVWDEPATGRFVAPAARRIGFVFQHYVLFDHLSALDNVAFGLRARGVSKADARARAADMLGRFGLDAVAHSTPAGLSGGQAQRVALARALVTDPEVLLLDEPLGALDVATRGTARREIARVVDRMEMARLLVTHDPVDAHALADRVVVIEDGRVTQRGTLAALAAAPRTPYVAELMGTNLVRGVLQDHVLSTLDGHRLMIGASGCADGPAIAAIRPAAVSLHVDRPSGSPRNVWATEVASIDRADDRVRVRVGAPLALVAEVTEAGRAALALAPNSPVWVSIKASEISVTADG